MNIQQKLKRSKEPSPLNLMYITCQNSDQRFVAVTNSKQLKVVPIWLQPVDEFEGNLYKEYIDENPNYRKLLTREKIAKMLQIASESLEEKYQLIVRAGHRPLSVQHQLIKMLTNKYLEDNPDASQEAALAYARTYLADPEIEIPPHVCGAAVDIDLLNLETGKLVDFGCPVNTDSPIAFLNSDKVTKNQKANRLMLLEIMLNTGFAPYFNEWWHYSYGDQTWAWFYNKPQSIFGISEPEL